MSKYNSLDGLIIHLLKKDARMPSAEIARQLSVSQRTINNRIKHLLDDQVIHPTIVFNPGAFGYLITVNIFCELQAGYEPGILDALSRFPEVASIAVSTGDSDLTLLAFFKSSEEMHLFITEKLHKIAGIRRTHTNLLPRIVKYSDEWIPPEFQKTPQVMDFEEGGA